MYRALIMIVLFLGLLAFVFSGLATNKDLNSVVILFCCTAFVVLFWGAVKKSVFIRTSGRWRIFLRLFVWALICYNTVLGLWHLGKYLTIIK